MADTQTPPEGKPKSRRASAGRNTRINAKDQRIEPPMRTSYEQLADVDTTARAGMHTVVVPTVDSRPGYRSPVAMYKDKGYVVLNTAKDELANSADVLMGIPEEEYQRREDERVRDQNEQLGYDAKGRPVGTIDGDTRGIVPDDGVMAGMSNRVQRKAAISLADAARDLPDS